MGSIASVLQWYCENCSLINPTERLNCERCGFSRGKKDFHGWIHSDIKQNDIISGLKKNEVHKNKTALNVKENYETGLFRLKSRKYFSWSFCFSVAKLTTLNRASSICTITRSWCCTHCKLLNITVSPSCVGCGYFYESIKNNTIDQKKELYFEEMECTPNWFSEVTSNSSSPAEITPAESTNTVVNLNASIDRKDGAFSGNHSPKRQSPSMYERVKNKVSRSLSNGSVVQKLLLENSAKCVLFKRPTSLIVDTNSSQQMQTDINKNDKESDSCELFSINNENHKKLLDLNKWVCSRCTLENCASLDKCEVCETPRKISESGNAFPKSDVVITVPEWDNADADPLKHKVIGSKTALPDSNKSNFQFMHSLSRENNTSPESQGIYGKPLYRRCYSEVNTPNPDNSLQNKVLINRRSLIETDTQSNFLITSTINHINASNPHSSVISTQKPKGFKYSYIGISEPLHKIYSNEKDDLPYNSNDRSLRTNKEFKNIGILKGRKLPIPPIEISLATDNNLPGVTLPAITYSTSSFNQNNASQKSTESLMNKTPESIPEISVINSKGNINDKNLRISSHDKIWQSDDKTIELIGRNGARNSYSCSLQSTNDIINDSNNIKNNSRMPQYETLWSNNEQTFDGLSNNENSSHFEKSLQINSSPNDSLSDQKNNFNNQNSCKSSKLNHLDRMWTCIKCSFAYNPIWSDCCDICNSVRSPPSLTEPSLITVTKDTVIYTPFKESGACNKHLSQRNQIKNNLNLNWSSTLSSAITVSSKQDFPTLTVPDNLNVSIKSKSIDSEKWTCKKCTLVSTAYQFVPWFIL